MNRSARIGFATMLALAGVAEAQEPRFVWPQDRYFLHGRTHSWFADLTGDGIVDRLDFEVVFVPSQMGPPPVYALHVTRGDPDGLFEDTRTEVYSGTTTFRFASLVDVDLDGDLDVIGGIDLFSREDKWLLLNDGSGRFDESRPHVPYSPGAFEPFGAVQFFLDIDGDGDVDAVEWEAYSPPIRYGNRVLVNDGAGSFAEQAGILPGDIRPSLFLDVDVDGDLDVFHWTAAGSALLLQREDATFAPALNADLEFPFYLVPFELESDGDPDLLTCDPSGQLRVLVNTGRGSFERGALLPLADRPLMALDADGDGNGDFIGTLYGDPTEQLILLRNTGDGTFVADPRAVPPELVLRPGFSPGADDVDQDGDVDIWTPGALALNDGSGQFVALSAGLRQPVDVDMGDLDGDGDLDFVLVEDPTGAIGFPARPVLIVGRNDGIGGVDLEQRADELTGATLLDVDGDGDLDVLAEALDAVRILRNSGDGAFASQPAVLTFFPRSMTGLAIGDLDGDGDPDFVVATSGRGQQDLTAFANDGTGSFVALPFIAPVPDTETVALALGDGDGDGDLDLMIGTDATRTREAYRVNDGTGQFTAVRAPIDGEKRDLRWLEFHDVDGDGDPDLLGFGNRVWINSGGQFREEFDRWEGAVGARFTVVDIDLDGDLDILDVPDLLWLNDGGGFFREAPELPPHREASHFGSTRFSAGDVDGDGDLDLATARPFRVLSNTEQHVSARSIPRVGKPLAMDVYGTPGAKWWLFASPSFTSFEAGLATDFGVLRLGDKHGLMRSGVLDDEGRATFRFDVPPFLELVGHAHYWQAVVGAPLRFTNVERTKFTGL